MLPSMRNPVRAFPLLILLAISVLQLDAKVLRVEITSRQDVLGGQSFGNAGPYERIVGKIYYAAPVGNWHDTQVFDLANAVNEKDGVVEFSADFIVIRPKDASKGNGSMLLEVPNRGSSRIVALVDGGDWDLAHNAGDGWLLRNGYTIAAVGWQWDAVGARCTPPLCPHREGEWKDHYRPAARRHDAVAPHGGDSPGAPDPGQDRRLRVSCRQSRRSAQRAYGAGFPGGAAHDNSAYAWQFAHTVDGKLIPSDRFIHLEGGFQPGKIYEYVYVVAGPCSGRPRVHCRPRFCFVVKALGRCHCPGEAGVRRGHLAERPLAARLSLSSLQWRRRRGDGARWSAGACCRGGARQL